MGEMRYTGKRRELPEEVNEPNTKNTNEEQERVPVEEEEEEVYVNDIVTIRDPVSEQAKKGIVTFITKTDRLKIKVGRKYITRNPINLKVLSPK